MDPVTAEWAMCADGPRVLVRAGPVWFELTREQAEHLAAALTTAARKAAGGGK